MNTANIHAQIKAVFLGKLRLTTTSQHKECTPNSRRLHYDHLKALKQQLRQYGIEPFASCRAGDITTGVELPRNLIKGLIDADIIGDKSYNVFVQERLVEEKKVFLIQ